MENKSRTCPMCNGQIPAFATAYTLQVRLFAEAGTLHITPDDLAENHERRMKETIENAQDADPQDLMDEVYESYTLTICPKCRLEFHQQFSQLSPFKDVL